MNTKTIVEQLAGLTQDQVIRVWDRAFLNYTPQAPDRWIDPEQEYSDFFDCPDVAVPVLQKIGDRDRTQAYVEYFAAVWRTHFSVAERMTTLPLLRQAAVSWTDRKDDLERLINAILKSPDQ